MEASFSTRASGEEKDGEEFSVEWVIGTESPMGEKVGS